MKYVLDSNVALKWVLRENNSDKARQLRIDYQQKIHELLVPDVFPIEVAHALARSERRGIITPAQGPMFLADILASQPQLHPYVPLLWRAYAISSQARIGVYDCLYVALAEREGCELLTADDRLVRTLQPTFPFINKQKMYDLCSASKSMKPLFPPIKWVHGYSSATMSQPCSLMVRSISLRTPTWKGNTDWLAVFRSSL